MAGFQEVASGVAFMRCGLVNVAAIGDAHRWVLLDAALPGYAYEIRDAAADRFGAGVPPAAILLSHGHFDHVGSIDALIDEWDAPVYAHPLELPYLTGLSRYAPPDPLVGRGMLAIFSRLYPRGPIDLAGHVAALPAGGAVPGLDAWRWIHTPGHTPGHVSFFRDGDRTLLSADAVVTTKQESVVAVVTQREELHGPPAYFTADWDSARDSVCVLAALAPEIVIAGHGRPMRGERLRDALYSLAAHFDARERPRFGRYARHPAVADETGIIALPPDPLPRVLAGVGAALAVAGVVAAGLRAARRRPSTRLGT